MLKFHLNPLLWTILRINLIDLRLQCSMAEADFNSAYDLMKSKIKLIKEGLA